METNFVDYVKICCRSGKGGDGAVHFHRDKFTTKGGPDGGDGGRGGHILLRGNKQLWTLLHLKYRKHVIAEDGENGSKNNMTGKSGKDVILEVPLGTVAKDAETGEIECEIIEDGQEYILVKGGKGGLGNAHFATPSRQAPQFAQEGEPGRTEWKILELKVLADVGLVGFPNAGKSTLLSVLTTAKPEIANYPFTTLVPQLGIVQYYDFKSFIMADLPGLIEGAAQGRGLGHRFLRHVERNAVLLFVISAENADVVSEYKILLNELKQYNPDLLSKKRLIAISKADILDNELMAEISKDINKKLKGKNKVPYIFISSHTGYNLQALKDLLWKTLNEA